MSNIIVVGAGAAGMMSAYFAAKNGHNVTIIEKNEKAGKKIYITGKGRCNITNACDVEELFDNVVTNKKFLYSSFYGFSNSDVVEFFNKAGLETKIERGNRVFPVSDKANDVISTLLKLLKEAGVKIIYDTKVEKIVTKSMDGTEYFYSCIAGKKEYVADAIIIATGGLSYPSTGSTGDGHQFAKNTGHTITQMSPALVPFTVTEEDVRELQGLSLKNSGVSIYEGKKKIYEAFGELLFTHYGVSGPTVLSASSYVAKKIKDHPLDLIIDLKPALSVEQLDERILRDFEEVRNRNFNNSLDKLLPKSLIPVIINRCGIDQYKKVNEISHDERMKLVNTIKNFRFTLTGLRGYNEAIVTQGGVSVKDIDPSTMESKKVKGMFFAGEVLDLDAVTGGFNLQIAWSTGFLAGSNACQI